MTAYINIHMYVIVNSSYHNNAYKSNIENYIRSFVLLIYMHYLHLQVEAHTFITARVRMYEECILFMAKC